MSDNTRTPTLLSPRAPESPPQAPAIPRAAPVSPAVSQVPAPISVPQPADSQEPVPRKSAGGSERSYRLCMVFCALGVFIGLNLEFSFLPAVLSQAAQGTALGLCLILAFFFGRSA